MNYVCVYNYKSGLIITVTIYLYHKWVHLWDILTISFIISVRLSFNYIIDVEAYILYYFITMSLNLKGVRRTQVLCIM